jgi:hypothetical protein
MAKKPSKKDAKVMTPKDSIATYRPSIHFGSDDANGLVPPEGDVGDDVQMTVHGKIASKSEHDHGDGPRKSMSVEIHKIAHGDTGEGMIADKTADGMKGAMDKALSAKQGKKGGFKKPAKGE